MTVQNPTYIQRPWAQWICNLATVGDGNWKEEDELHTHLEPLMFVTLQDEWKKLGETNNYVGPPLGEKCIPTDMGIYLSDEFVQELALRDALARAE
jgi:hypothetical protein